MRIERLGSRADIASVEAVTDCKWPKVAVNGVGTERALDTTMPIPQGESHDERSYAVIGAAMEVHRQVGCGFLERVYSEALALELKLRGIPYKREVRFAITYKDRLLPVTYLVDFVCEGVLIVEVKALPAIGPPERAQVLNYLRASGLARAVLLNFGATSLQMRRFVCDRPGTSRPRMECLDVPAGERTVDTA